MMEIGKAKIRAKSSVTRAGFGPFLPRFAGCGRIGDVNLSHYLTMDPHMLIGLVNTELRNHCDSLEDLVKTHNLDPEKLIKVLEKAGYVYHPEQNQFR